MARKKYIRRRIVKLPSIHERFHAPKILDDINEILATEQKRYKYVRFGITTDLKTEYDLRKQRDDIQWSSMKVYYSTPHELEATYIHIHNKTKDNYIPTNIFNLEPSVFNANKEYYLYVMVGRRKKSKKVKKNRQYTFIDLFAGCGGLSEGFYRLGFKALAHVEFDKKACETLRMRMKHYKYNDIENAVIEHDITADDIIERIDNALQGRKPDIIIGGPPCQAYSTAGRVRDGEGMAKDPRNFLFESYVKILEHYEPKFFVFENVTGILSAKVNGKRIFPIVLKALGNKYKLIDDPEILVHNTANYGVPQIRKRVIIMGVHKSLENKDAHDLYNDVVKTHYDPEMNMEQRKELKRFVDVKDALGDLPPVEPGQDVSTDKFNYPRRNEYLKRIGKSGIHPLYDHICRNHNEKDRERFKVMIENHWSFGVMRRNRPDLEHEHARLFDNSYVVQWWDLPSKTILAHLHKDGFQFIHPDIKQLRTFTVREAARIQSFPDDFEFAGSRGDKYKQIGNAVPPLFAEALALSIKKNLDELKDDI